MDKKKVKMRSLKELQSIVENLKNDTCKKYNLQDIKIKAKNNKRGHANYKNRFISIPVWAYYQENIYHFKYYTLHELSHFIAYDLNKITGHEGNFKEVEQKLLKENNMIPIYKIAYVKELLDSNIKDLTLWKE